MGRLKTHGQNNHTIHSIVSCFTQLRCCAAVLIPEWMVGTTIWLTLPGEVSVSATTVCLDCHPGVVVSIGCFSIWNKVNVIGHGITT